MDKKGSFVMTAKFEVRPREPTAPHIANYWQWSSLLKPSGLFLWGLKFTVRTDHASLRWLKSFKEPEGMLARWLSVLGTYDFVLEHRPGAKHGNADGLSRTTGGKKCKPCPRDDCPQCVSVS